MPRSSRPDPRRAVVRLGAWSLAATLALLLATPSLARRVKHLEIPQAVELPVYTVDAAAPPLLGTHEYRLGWSGLPVARVSLTAREVPDESGIAVDVIGATHPVIDWIYRYRFDANGLVGTAPFAPRRFDLDVCEKGRSKQTQIRFPASGKRIESLRQSRGREKLYWFESDNTWDIPSAVYLVLNLPYEAGARYTLDTFTGRSRYLVSIDVEELETLRIGERERAAWRLRLRTEELTDDDDENAHRETFVWITPERPRTLLRARSDVWVGSITLDLADGEPLEPLRPSACDTRHAGL
ncbi:MAG: DUF3108 domain-containing protein [Myxococcota bacterium]